MSECPPLLEQYKDEAVKKKGGKHAYNQQIICEIWCRKKKKCIVAVVSAKLEHENLPKSR